MKKQVMTMAAAAALLVLAGCGTAAATSTADSAPAKADGVYTARMKDASYGWQDQLVVEYRDGVIVSADFDSYDADGNRKSQLPEGAYPMEPSPSEWIPQLSENVEKAGRAFKIDNVSGATESSENARALLAAIEAGGKPGEVLLVG